MADGGESPGGRGTGIAGGAAHDAATGGAFTLHIGGVTMRVVVEIEDLRAPPQMFISDITRPEIEPHAHLLCPQFFDAPSGDCRLSQHAWLIETKAKKILVDPCVRHRRHRPEVPFYHMIDSPFMDRLATLGVAPEDIDYVFCTHLHLDHVGWNTRLMDGRYVPSFPNARYLFSRAEDEFWRRDLTHELPPEESFNAGVYAECIQPVMQAGLAELVEAGQRIAECITLIDAGGHTIGHLAGVLEDGGVGAVLAGDAIHHPVQVLLPDRHVHALDPEQGRATRRRLLDLCAEKDYWLAPAHFRAPHVCKIRKEGDGYRMEWA